jgi:hypothetical protein
MKFHSETIVPSQIKLGLDINCYGHNLLLKLELEFGITLQ